MIMGCLTNMIQRPLPRDSVSEAVLNSNDIPGALNLGLTLANFTLQFLTFFANISPLLSGYLSDSKLGKFNSIKFGIYIGILGHFLLIFSSIPSVMKFPYFAWTVILLSVVIIAFFAGFIKSNILPLLLDQYELHEDKPDFKVENDRVYAINHKATLDNLSISFYMFINWGCTFSLFGSFIERSFGFWPIYLSTALLFSCLPLVLNFVNKRLILSKPKKSVDTQVYLEFYYHLKNYLFSSSIPVTNSIESVSVFDIKNFINCLKLFMFFIPFYLNVSALTSIQISLGATMYNSLNMPNDIYQAINPLTIILILPLLSNLIYPSLLKVNKLPTSKAKIYLDLYYLHLAPF